MDVPGVKSSSRDAVADWQLWTWQQMEATRLENLAAGARLVGRVSVEL